MSWKNKNPDGVTSPNDPNVIKLQQQTYDMAMMSNCDHRYYSRVVARGKLSDEAYREIALYSPLLEIFAGSGIHAEVLTNQFGADVMATETYNSKGFSSDWKFLPSYEKVRMLPADEAVRINQGRVLLMVWPPQDPTLLEALRSYTELGGTAVLYAGEARGGRTADDEFFKFLDQHWSHDKTISIPSFLGCWDSLYIYHRPQNGEGTGRRSPRKSFFM